MAKFKIGEVVSHKVWGTGEVVKVYHSKPKVYGVVGYDVKFKDMERFCVPDSLKKSKKNAV